MTLCCVDGRNWLTFNDCIQPPLSGLDNGGSKHFSNVGQFLPDVLGATPHDTSRLLVCSTVHWCSEKLGWVVLTIDGSIICA
jgi:hypothetical protein